MVTPPQQFCVRWNSYQSNLQNAFPKLLNSEHFVDVTLACENEMLKCHKVVLSACSTYFEKLLLDNPCQHPIIFMKDMKFQEMQSLVDFMYKGEVNVTQDDLPSLLKSAEALQIRGLCGHDQLLSQQQLGALKPQPKPVLNNSVDNKNHHDPLSMKPEPTIKKEDKTESESGGNHPSSSECDSNDGVQNKGKQLSSNLMASSNHLRKFFPEHQPEVKEEGGDNDSYYEGESDLMDTEFLEEDVAINTNDLNKTPEFAIANVSCQYDGSPGSAGNRRIRRSDEELRRAAECITRGQTFQTVSDQFNIPISTIRFYMARKGILPRRKRGRACSGPTGLQGQYTPVQTYNSPGNTSPVGPPYHIVHYKLPALGVSKLK